MMSNSDDQLDWDETPSIRPLRAKRPASKYRHRDYDVIAEIVDEGGALKPLLIVGASVLVALGLILFVVLSTAPPRDEVAFQDDTPKAELQTPETNQPVVPKLEPKPEAPKAPPPPPLAVVPRPVDPSPTGHRIDVQLGQRVTLPFQHASWLTYSAKHKQLALVCQENYDNILVVYEPTQQKVVKKIRLSYQQSTLSLSPDESLLYALNFYSTNATCLRYTFATESVESVEIPKNSTQVAAVSADAFLVRNEQTKLTSLYRWPTGSKTLTKLWEKELGSGFWVYDPYEGQIVSCVEYGLDNYFVRYLVTEQEPFRLSPLKEAGWSGRQRKNNYGESRCSIDCRDLIDFQNLYSMADLDQAPRVFPQKIHAVSRDVVFGAEGACYRLTDSKLITNLGFHPGTVALGQDGQSGWVLQGQFLYPLRIQASTGTLDPDTEQRWELPKPPYTPDPFLGGTPLVAAEVQRLRPTSAEGTQTVYLAQHNLFITLTGTQHRTLTVLNPVTGEKSETKIPFLGLDASLMVSPDLSTAFLLSNNQMYRYDVALRDWKAYRWEGLKPKEHIRSARALSSDRFVANVISYDVGPPTARLMTFRCGQRRLIPLASTVPAEQSTDLQFDTASRTLFVTTISYHREPTEIRRYCPAPEGWEAVDTVTTKLEFPKSNNLPTFELGQGGLQFGQEILTPFGKIVPVKHQVAAVGFSRIVTTKGEIRDAMTDALLGTLGQPVRVAWFTLDGKGLWIRDEFDHLVRFDLSVAPKGIVAKVQPPPGGWFPAPKKPVGDQSPASGSVQLTPTNEAITEYFDAKELRIAQSLGLLFGVTYQNQLHSLDIATGKVVEPAFAIYPDHRNFGKVLTTAPGGEGAFALGDKTLFRFDPTKRKWDRRDLISNEIVAVSPEVVVARRTELASDGSGGMKTNLTLMRWTDAATLTIGPRATFPYHTVSMVFNPVNGRLYALSAETNPNGKQTVREYQCTDDQIEEIRSFPLETTGFPNPGPDPLAVNPAGNRLFTKQFVIPLDGTGKPFPQKRNNLWAVGRDVVVGGDFKLYRMDNDQLIGPMPEGTLSGRFVFTPDGRTAWGAEIALKKNEFKPVFRRFEVQISNNTVPVAPPPKPKEPITQPGIGPTPKANSGTTVAFQEVERIPTVAKDGHELIAAEPLGVVLFLSTPNGGRFQLYDLATKKQLPVDSPLPITYNVLTPLDRSALFLIDHRDWTLLRLNKAKTGWEKNKLPAGVRSVLPLSRDKWFAVVDNRVSGASVVVHEMEWGEDTAKTLKEGKPNRLLLSTWLGAEGQLSATGVGVDKKEHVFEYTFENNELKMTRDRAIITKPPIMSIKQISRDRRFLFDHQTPFFIDSSVDKLVAQQLPSPVLAASSGWLMTRTGEYFTPEGKSMGKLGFAIRGADVTPDGKTLWVLDDAKKELVKLTITDKK